MLAGLLQRTGQREGEWEAGVGNVSCKNVRARAHVASPHTVLWTTPAYIYLFHFTVEI
jgi:hypothetical protein